MAIILPSGFNILNNEPVDARITLADESTRYALSSANVYEGLIIFQQDNNTIWVLTDTSNVGNSNGWTQLQLGSVDSNLPSGVVSGSDQVLGGTGILSSSNETFSNFSSSVDVRLDNIEGFTSSIDDTIKTKLDTEGVVSGSDQVLGGTGILSSSNENFNDFSSSVDNRLDNIEGFTSSIDTTIKTKMNSDGVVSGSEQIVSLLPSGVVSGSDQLTGSLVDLTSDQTISGTKTFNDIVVNGTGSFAYITSVSGTAKIVGDSYIILNNDTPTQRYAGIAVYDSGSVTPTTASFNFDGETNDWFYEYSASTVDYGVVLFGPEYNTKGNPTYLTTNTIPKAEGTHHLNDSNISDDGSTITLNSNSEINGDLLVNGNVESTNLESHKNISVTSSTQLIEITSESIVRGYISANQADTYIVSDGGIGLYTAEGTDGVYIASNGNTTIYGTIALQTIPSNSTSTAALVVGAGNILNYRTLGAGAFVGYANTSTSGIVQLATNSDTSTATSTTKVITPSNLSSITTLGTITTGNVTAILPLGVISGSSQVSFDDISSNPFQNGIGTIDTTGHLLPATTEIYDLGSATKRWRDLYLSGSTIDLGGTLISRDTETGNIKFIDSGSGTAVSADVDFDTITNKPTLVSGSAQITKSLQDVTSVGNTTSTIISITNTTAAISKTTGALIVSGGIGTSGDVFAGGDVVAYASSDIRLKDNILPIENPLQKINQIGGYSFEWNQEKQHIYKGKDYGVIAQEIEQILPELVNTRENGYKAVNYDKLISLLIEGVKDLSKQVEDLKQKINKG